jgi:hypothetical protein
MPKPRKPRVSKGIDPEKRKQRIIRYKAKHSDYKRLDLMLLPDQLERFKQLPGLERQPYPERLAALMDCWEQYQAAAPQVLDQITASLDAFDQVLVAEDTTARTPFWQEPLPDVPPLPKTDRAYYRQLSQAIEKLNQQNQRRHGNSKGAQKWKARLRQEPELMKAFLALAANRGELGDLIRHGCLNINPNHILAWAELEEADQRAVIWYLVHAGTIHPEALGAAGQHFKQALERQPQRGPITWERTVTG